MVTGIKLLILPLILLALVSCNVDDKVKLKINQERSSSVQDASITSINVSNNQLIISGTKLKDVANVKVRTTEGDKTFTVESAADNQVVANPTANTDFKLGTLLQLVLSDARAASSFTISMSLSDGSVTAAKLNDMGAADGEVLTYNSTSGFWEPSPLTGLTYQGTWNANTDTPNLTGASPIAGDFYIVTTAGATNLDGITTWNLGDWAIYDGAAWDRVPSSAPVTQVFGRAGSITATEGDYTINLLGDVDTTTVAPNDGDVLTWDLAGGNWVPGVISFTETDPNVTAFAKAALPTCGAGEVLKGDGTSLSCVTDQGLTSYTETDPNVTGFAKAALPTCAAGEVLKGDGTSLSCVSDSTTPGAQTIADTQLSGIAASCANGEVLKTNGLGSFYCAADNDTHALETTIEGYIANDITTGYVPYDNGTKLVSSNIYYDGSKVGIGTATPDNPLDVSASVNVGNNTIGHFYNTATGNSLVNIGGTAGYTYFGTDSNGEGFFGSMTGGKGLRILAAGGEKMKVLANGNVGIGISNPSATLDVNGGIEATQICDETGANCKDISAGWGIMSESDPNVTAFAKAALPTCGAGEVLKGDGTSLSCVTDLDTNTQLSEASVESYIGNDVTSGYVAYGNGTKLTGSNIFYNNATSKVGIGTNNPSQALEVTGNILATVDLQAQQICDETGANCKDISTGWSESDPKVGANTTNYVSKWNGSALVASSIVDNAGSVGIGTATPFRQLHMQKPTVSTEIIMEVADGLADFKKWNIGINGGTGVAQQMFFRQLNDAASGGNVPLRLQGDGDVILTESSGNVGIGTTTPGDLLDVAGNIRAQQICDETGANCKDISTGWGTGGSVTSVASGTGLTGGPITTTGTLSVDVGTTSGKIPQLDGGGKLATSVETDPNVTAFAKAALPTCGAGEVLKGDGTSLSCVTDIDTNTQLSEATVESYIGNDVTTGYIPYDNGTKLVDSNLYFNGTYTGIGTATPLTALHITEVDDTWNSSFRMDRSWDTTTDYFQMMYDFEGFKLRTETDADGDSAHIIFKPKNVEAMRITDAGKVGIGTSTPGDLLDVNGNIRAQQICDESGANCKDISTGWSESDPKVGANTTNYVSKWNGSALVASTIYNIGGSVGLGTTNPQRLLHMHNSTVSTEIIMEVADGLADFKKWNIVTGGGAGVAQQMYFRQLNDATTGGNVPLRLQGDGDVILAESSGNVGIGTTTPGDKLDVNGNIRAQQICDETGANCKDISTGWSGGSDNLGDHTATQNINLSTFKLVGNGGTAGIEIDAAGKVGVGTATPTANLHVYGAPDLNNGHFQVNHYTGGIQRSLAFAAAAVPKVGGGFNTDVTSVAIVAGIGSAHNLTFGNRTVGETMRIDTAGKVGIGTTAPTTKLEVADSTTSAKLTLNNTRGIADESSVIYFSKNGAAQWMLANDLSQNGTQDFQIRDQVAGAARIYINSTGDVGIGNTAPGGHKLSVTGTAGLSTGTSWTNTSDIRLKDVHGPYEHGLKEIMDLNVIRFNYKKDNPVGLPSDREVIGFVAQEVQKVIPEAVTERSDGFLELNVDPIHWALVNATKEQQEIIDNNHEMFTMMHEGLKKQVDENSREIASLKEENKMLKAFICSKFEDAPFCEK